MARSQKIVDALGSPTATAFEVAINAYLATLLSSLIGGWDVVVTDKFPQYTRQYRAILDTATGGTVITHPYLVKVIEGSTDLEATVLAGVFLAANPTYWAAPVLYRYSDLISSMPTRSLLFLLYNTDATDGAANWQPGFVVSGGGAPGGPAGGDLSGTYPNPIVGPTTTGSTSSGAIPASATVLASVAIASFQDMAWEVVLTKGATRYSTTVRANINDSTTPTWVESDVAVSPPSGGTFDCPLTVDISGGLMRLVCTPATTGWAARTRARAFAV